MPRGAVPFTSPANRPFILSLIDRKGPRKGIPTHAADDTKRVICRVTYGSPCNHACVNKDYFLARRLRIPRELRAKKSDGRCGEKYLAISVSTLELLANDIFIEEVKNCEVKLEFIRY